MTDEPTGGDPAAADSQVTDDATTDDDLEEQIAYELDGWARENRELLGRLLESEAIAHAWEAGTLVVRVDDEDRVDHLVEQVELGSGLDPDEEQVVYDLDGWTDEQQDELVDQLTAAGIAYEWDEDGGLAVRETDEERVEALLDAIEYPDALPAEDADRDDEDDEGDEGDGLLAQDTLSELFVAADRLTHDPEDHEGVLSLVDAARLVATLPLPFGFEKATWDAVLARVGELRTALEGDADDDDVLDKARSLRMLLRQYV